ncbi:MAG: hypothetical protein OEL54_05920, partial [Flavobacteriaceae bacterium]|nr:hypothetical protein [Flavobacteriaceae bacterium]
MAIVNNISTETGDIIRFKTESHIVGIIALTAFSDSTTGENATKYFEKFFRYSLDGGITFSDWIELTTVNVTNIQITQTNQFVADCRYTRVGSDPTGELAFNSITLSGDSEDLPYPVYYRTIFSKFFDVNNVNVLGWALNVLEKLYKQGIIPDYITRGEDELNPTIDDVDYLSFFYSMTHFWAIIVYYARQFRDIINNDILLNKFIFDLGLYLNTNITLTHLQYIFENYPDEFRKRGTSAIVSYGDETIPNGELLRLISYTTAKEFIFALLEPHATGWCISKSSPSFNYTTHCMNMIKGYEEGEGIADLNKYPLSSSSYISIVDNKMEIE